MGRKCSKVGVWLGKTIETKFSSRHHRSKANTRQTLTVCPRNGARSTSEVHCTCCSHVEHSLEPTAAVIEQPTHHLTNLQSSPGPGQSSRARIGTRVSARTACNFTRTSSREAGTRLHGPLECSALATFPGIVSHYRSERLWRDVRRPHTRARSQHHA